MQIRVKTVGEHTPSVDHSQQASSQIITKIQSKIAGKDIKMEMYTRLKNSLKIVIVWE